jgi:hypothetical protein
MVVSAIIRCLVSCRHTLRDNEDLLGRRPSGGRVIGVGVVIEVGAELRAHRTSEWTATRSFVWYIGVVAALVSGASAAAVGETPIPSTGPITGTLP